MCGRSSGCRGVSTRVRLTVFPGDVSRWLTLSNGLVVAVLSGAGLVAHELSSERVIHVLEVSDRSDRLTS